MRQLQEVVADWHTHSHQEHAREQKARRVSLMVSVKAINVRNFQLEEPVISGINEIH